MIPALAAMVACYCVARLLMEPAKFTGGGRTLAVVVCALAIMGVIGSCAMIQMAGSQVTQ